MRKAELTGIFHKVVDMSGPDKSFARDTAIMEAVSPNTFSFSMRITLAPNWAAPDAMVRPAAPPPRIPRSKSKIATSSSLITDIHVLPELVFFDL